MMQAATIQRRGEHAGAGAARRGAVLVWFVCLVPFMLLILIAVTDFGTMALARVELQNAIDAAALSAVKSWSLRGDTAAFDEAEIVFAANPVTARLLNPNASSTRPTTAAVAGAVTESTTWLGLLEDSAGTHVFHTLKSSDPEKSEGTSASPGFTVGPSMTYCVRVRRTIQIGGLTPSWLKNPLGPYDVTAEAYARLDWQSGQPQLVHVDGIADPD